MGNTAALWVPEDLLNEVWPDNPSRTNVLLEYEVTIEDRANSLKV
jgi:hypothetical protein